jgi:hypothetical protein
VPRMNSVMSRLAKFSNRLIPIRDRVAPSDRSTQVPPIGVPLRPLNMAEIERGVPRGQCLDRRIVTPIKSLPRGSFWANAVFFASVRGIMRRGIFAFPAAQRHAAGGGTLREIPQAASSRPDTATVIARFGAFLALLGNRKSAGNSFSAHHTASSNIPVRLLGRAPIFPRKEVFPKTFVRRRRIHPKIGQTAKKWLKLTGESEIDGVLEPVPRFFQASPIRPGLAARPDPIGSPLQ